MSNMSTIKVDAKVTLLAAIAFWLATPSNATERESDGINDAANTLQICLRGETDVLVTAELALDADTRARGLMERESLAADHGMLFVYPNDGIRAFWMYKTLIPLDIAYIDRHGVITEILTMAPCRSIFPGRCRNYPATKPFRMALEVNAKHFEEWHISAGDQLYQQDCKTPLRALLAHD